MLRTERFAQQGEGVMVPYSSCLSKRGAYSIVLDARLEDTNGNSFALTHGESSLLTSYWSEST